MYVDFRYTHIVLRENKFELTKNKNSYHITMALDTNNRFLSLNKITFLCSNINIRHIFTIARHQGFCMYEHFFPEIKIKKISFQKFHQNPH